MSKNTSKPVALVLGGTVPHIELIRQLKARGYYTVLVDYLENPPACPYADLHLRESTLDDERVYQLALENDAELVIATCIDHANTTCCHVLEKMGKHAPYSYHTSVVIADKSCMKEVMQKYDIPTARHCTVQSVEEALKRRDLKYPLMVKPSDSNSATGVKKVNNQDEMRVFLAEALGYSRNGKAVIEEYKTGVEVSAYCFVEGHRAKLLMAAQRMSVIEGEKQVIKCYATVAPAQLSDEAYRRIEEAACKIAEAYGLNNTPLQVQAFVNGDEISVIEYAPRIGGGMSYKTIYDNTGFDIISAAIDSYLGIPVHVKACSPKGIRAINIIYAVPAIYDHIEGQDELLAENVIDGIYYYKTKGMRISDEKAASARIGSFVVSGESMVEIKAKLSKAMDRLEVYAQDGSKIMRKELSLLRDI